MEVNGDSLGQGDQATHGYEVAERIGTTQSAVARLESGSGKHSPSLATLQKYAHALGCRLELRLVNEAIKAGDLTKHSTERAKKTARRSAGPGVSD